MKNIVNRTLLLVVFTLFTFVVCSADGYYRRHYHLVVDQTGSIQAPNVKSQINELLSILALEFMSPNGKLNFDPEKDEMSLYVFGVDGHGQHMNNATTYTRIAVKAPYTRPEKLYDEFLGVFVQHRGDFTKSGVGADEFIGKNIKSLFYRNDPLAKKIAQYSGVTLSKYVYPATIDVMEEHQDKPSIDDILIFITDYQSGSDDQGASQDARLLRNWVGGSAYEYFSKRFEGLEEPFYRVPVNVQQVGSKSTNVSYPMISASKLVVKSLEGVNPYMISNVSLTQLSYKSKKYSANDIQISFNHGVDLEVEKVVLAVKDENGVVFEGVAEDHKQCYNPVTKIYTFPKRDIDLGKSFDEGDKVLLDYTFYTKVKSMGDANMSKVFSVVRDFEFADEHIITPAEDTTTMLIAVAIAAVMVILLVLLAVWIKRRRGLCPVKGIIKIGSISNERFLRVKNNEVTSLDCWYWDVRGNTERGITVEVGLDIAQPKFSKKYDYILEAKVSDLDANYDFSFKPNSGKYHTPQGGVYGADEWVPITFEDNRGQFLVVAYLDTQNTSQPNFSNDNILKMGISIRAMRKLSNGTVQNVVFENNGQNVITEEYNFIVRPKLDDSNLWVAFDPGTSGSCIAYGVAGSPTDSRDLFIAQNTYEKLDGTNKFTSIFPSKIRIKRDSHRLATASGDVVTSEEAEKLVDGVDFDFGNSAEILWGNFNCFQSIKKLLGYKNSQKILVRNANGDKNDLIKEVSGKDLGHLLVKSLYNRFVKYIKENEHVDKVVREQFLAGCNQNDQKLAVQRAIVAVPNSYTLDKIQDMVDSVDRTGHFKEVHYIYESEAVFMTYLRQNWAKIGELQNDRIFIVYDMGGATINVTAFKLKVELDAYNNVDRVYVITLAKIGYTIGGDDIDYALIQVIYGLPTVKEALKAMKPDRISLGDYEAAHQLAVKEELLRFVREMKLSIIARTRLEASSENKDSMIQDAETFYGRVVALFKDFKREDYRITLGEFNDDVRRYLANQYNKFDKKGGSKNMNNYVISQVCDAVDELIKMLPTNESKNLEMIFSGRSVLYPYIKHNVYKVIKENNYEINEWDGLKENGVESPELLKTAVAKGACWFAMYSSRIRLDHGILTTTIGYIDNKAAQDEFVPLLTAGTHFKDGELQSDKRPPIYANLSNVRFVQMMGADYNTIWRKGLSHKYSLLANITQREIIGNIEYISAVANDCGEVTCTYKLMMEPNERVQNLIGAMRLDVTDDNSGAYIFATTNASLEAKAGGADVELYDAAASNNTTGGGKTEQRVSGSRKTTTRTKAHF